MYGRPVEGPIQGEFEGLVLQVQPVLLCLKDPTAGGKTTNSSRGMTWSVRASKTYRIIGQKVSARLVHSISPPILFVQD